MTYTEAEKDAWFDPAGQAETPQTDTDYTYTSDILGSPDYATFVKHVKTPRAKEYETKLKSMLKACTLAAFKNDNPVDAATILHFGDSFAAAAADLTDTSDRVARTIDFLTAPDNPWFVFATAALPFAMQLFRNHEREAQVLGMNWRERRAMRKRMKAEGIVLVPEQRQRQGTPVTVRGPFGRKFTFRLHLPKPKVVLNVFRAQTHEPTELARKVLSDEKLLRELKKQGITITVQRGTDYE